MGGVSRHRAEASSCLHRDERQLAANLEDVRVRTTNREEFPLLSGPAQESLVAGRRHRRGVRPGREDVLSGQQVAQATRHSAFILRLAANDCLSRVRKPRRRDVVSCAE